MQVTTLNTNNTAQYYTFYYTKIELIIFNRKFSRSDAMHMV